MAGARTLTGALLAAAAVILGGCDEQDASLLRGAEETAFRSFVAYRLAGHGSEALVVPQLGGRVMVYGAGDGTNLLWTAPGDTNAVSTNAFVDWGGDKTYVGPRAGWDRFAEAWTNDAQVATNAANGWPLHPTWHARPHAADATARNMLFVDSRHWEGYGIQIRRVYQWTGKGVLRIRQDLRAAPGDAQTVALLSETQVRPPDAVYMLSETNVPPASEAAAGLLRLAFDDEAPVDIALQANRTALAAQYGDQLWVLCGGTLDGRADGSASDLNNVRVARAAGAQAVTLELQSPAVRLAGGLSCSYPVYWSLHPMPEDLAGVKQLLESEPE